MTINLPMLSTYPMYSYDYAPHHYAVNPVYAALFTPHWFEPDWWRTQQAITGYAKGRGITWFMHYQGHDLVLRHYYRGGFFGKLFTDTYFFTGFKRSRAVQEYQLLLSMLALQLPVPTPWAVRVTRRGWYYSTDILLERIAHAQDLVHLLCQQALSANQWQAIGATIQQFHTAGIYHADLNSHNILLDQANKVWLLDFDKGYQRHGQSWKQANLQRLYRSFVKEKRLQPSFHWQAADWQALLQGYNGNTSVST